MIKKGQIIFLEPWPTVMIYKMAKMLRERGWETISIRILETDKSSDDFYKPAFDKIISFKFGFFKLNVKNIPSIFNMAIKKTRDIFIAIRYISKLHPSVIIARATPSWPGALVKKLVKKCPVIYFPYDMRSLGVISKEEDKKINSIPEFEFKAERFCFENCDGIINKGSQNALEYVKKSVIGRNIKIAPMRINFGPYCSEEFIVPLNRKKLSKKDNEIHMVFIGSVGLEGINADNHLIAIFNELIKQKIHVYVYNAANVARSDENTSEFSEGALKILNSKYFHTCKPLDPKTIIKEISKYDFGLFLSSEPISKDSPEKSGGFGTGNKIASYLEAGIPFFYNNGFIFVDELMKKYRLRLLLGDLEDYKKLKKNVSKLDYPTLEKKVIKARKDFLMEKHLPRLEKFIIDVIKIKKVHNKFL
jgi:hypothetical protein